jgi:transposase
VAFVTHRRYTDQFKQETVGLLASSGRPLSQIAEEVGIPAARLRTWRKNGSCAITA